MPLFDAAEVDAFAEAIIKGGEAKIYGIERRPGETDDELTKRVAAVKAALE